MLIGATAGSLLTRVFASRNLGSLGLPEGVSIMDQVGIQAIAIVATICWCAVISYGLLKMIDKIIGLRVSEDKEVQGLGLVLHEETGCHDL